jgi:hypothetical protein
MNFNRSNGGLKIFNLAAALVMLGRCFDMLLPAVPSNLVAYLWVTKTDVSPQLSLLLLGLLRALGGCLLAIGIVGLLIINGPVKRGERWVSWALSALSLSGWAWLRFLIPTGLAAS